MLPVVLRNRKPANIGLDVIFAGKLSYVALRRQKIKSFPISASSFAHFNFH